jgi:hypothetical protein
LRAFISLANSGLPLVDLPEAFSLKICSQPAAFSASTWAAWSWVFELTLA